MMHRVFVTLSAAAWVIALLALNACAAEPAGYQPLTADPSSILPNAVWGYTEIPVGADRYEVDYFIRGNGNPTSARYYATVRAAELAVQHGKAYFEIVEVSPWESPEAWAALAGATATRPAPAESPFVPTGGPVVDLIYVDAPIVVHLTAAPSPAALDALDVLRRARQQGVVFSPQTEARLMASGAATGGP